MTCSTHTFSWSFRVYFIWPTDENEKIVGLYHHICIISIFPTVHGE